ncbi:MAG: hypothetical protein P4L84_11530 [Isosphaeraceae bacterium]|nr:hypothetical protein [Isosphaeraceae bacterium]
MTTPRPADVSIGKFDILATYTYAKALHDGLDEDKAKQRGMVAAIMGAHARLGLRREHRDDFDTQKAAAERKKKTTITAGSFDHQVRDKLGDFFDATFLPAMKDFVAWGMSYDQVKALVKIPRMWGAKVRGEAFQARWREAKAARRANSHES